MSARIVALADVYDALTSERSYKPAYSHDMARSLIVAQSGAHFDPDLVEAVSMKLEAEKFRVTKAYDGKEAWTRIKEKRPDLIILDVMMPEKNGYMVCDELKKDPKYKDIFSFGCYHTHLQRYFEFFPPEQILVLEYERLSEDRQLWETLFKFLGVSAGPHVKPGH